MVNTRSSENTGLSEKYAWGKLCLALSSDDCHKIRGTEKSRCQGKFSLYIWNLWPKIWGEGEGLLKKIWTSPCKTSRNGQQGQEASKENGKNFNSYFLLPLQMIIPLMFNVREITFPEVCWPKEWPEQNFPSTVLENEDVVWLWKQTFCLLIEWFSPKWVFITHFVLCPLLIKPAASQHYLG